MQCSSTAVPFDLTNTICQKTLAAAAALEVNHAELIVKHQAAIDNRPITYSVKSLFHRTQFVSLYPSPSRPAAVTSGLLQASVLDPLCLIFINDTRTNFKCNMTLITCQPLRTYIIVFDRAQII